MPRDIHEKGLDASTKLCGSQWLERTPCGGAREGAERLVGPQIDDGQDNFETGFGWTMSAKGQR